MKTNMGTDIEIKKNNKKYIFYMDIYLVCLMTVSSITTLYLHNMLNIYSAVLVTIIIIFLIMYY